MAAPHVAGVAALIVGRHGGELSPAAVERIGGQWVVLAVELLGDRERTEIRHLGLVEREVARHAHLAFDQLGAAGAAHARGAGERHLEPGGRGRVEDARVVLREIELALEAIADDRDALFAD